MARLIIVLGLLGVAACSSEPSYMSKDRDLEFYRENSDVLARDLKQCAADVKAGETEIQVCWALGSIKKKLENQKARDKKSAADVQKEINKAAAEALNDVELDIKWGQN